MCRDLPDTVAIDAPCSGYHLAHHIVTASTFDRGGRTIPRSLVPLLPLLPRSDAKTEMQLKVDYSLVIIKDVLEGEDKDERFTKGPFNGCVYTLLVNDAVGARS